MEGKGGEGTEMEGKGRRGRRGEGEKEGRGERKGRDTTKFREKLTPVDDTMEEAAQSRPSS